MLLGYFPTCFCIFDPHLSSVRLSHQLATLHDLLEAPGDHVAFRTVGTLRNISCSRFERSNSLLPRYPASLACGRGVSQIPFRLVTQLLTQVCAHRSGAKPRLHPRNSGIQGHPDKLNRLITAKRL